MRSIEVRLATAAYSQTAVVAAAHRYSDRLAPAITVEGDSWVICFASSTDIDDEEAWRHEFLRSVLDEQLREAISVRTAGIHQILIAAALQGARTR